MASAVLPTGQDQLSTSSKHKQWIIPNKGCDNELTKRIIKSLRKKLRQNNIWARVSGDKDGIFLMFLSVILRFVRLGS